MPIAATARPTSSGAMFMRGGWLRWSVRARTNITRKPVPTTWSTNGQIMLARKYGAGKVAKMLKVAVGRLVAGDRVVVDEVDQRGARERTDQLGDDVGDHLDPWEVAAHRQRERYRRVDVRAADSPGHIDAEGDRQRPPPGDKQPVAAGREDLGAASGLVQRGDGHRHHAVAEADEHERAEEFARQLTPDGLPPCGTRRRPCSCRHVTTS